MLNFEQKYDNPADYLFDQNYEDLRDADEQNESNIDFESLNVRDDLGDTPYGRMLKGQIQETKGEFMTPSFLNDMGIDYTTNLKRKKRFMFEPPDTSGIKGKGSKGRKGKNQVKLLQQARYDFGKELNLYKDYNPDTGAAKDKDPSAGKRDERDLGHKTLREFLFDESGKADFDRDITDEDIKKATPYNKP